MRVIVFGSNYQDEIQIKDIIQILSSKTEVELLVESSFYQYLKSLMNLDPCNFHSLEIKESTPLVADLAISIGGDGTLLRTADLVGDKGIPIIGINTGRLGFLADVSSSDFEEALNLVLSKNYTLEERTLLHLTCKGSGGELSGYALNDITILKHDLSMIRVHTNIDGQYLSSYDADGLVISTPTGSTAYSLSIGGSILAPTSTSFILSAVAPHSLTARPLVIPDNSVLDLEVESRSDNFLISLDGRSEILPKDTQLQIKKAKHKLKLVKLPNSDFYKTLRDKLHWGSDPRIVKES